MSGTSWGRRATRVSALLTISPESGGMSPLSIFRRVDLPAPFRPSRPIRSPASIGERRPVQEKRSAETHGDIMDPYLCHQDCCLCAMRGGTVLVRVQGIYHLASCSSPIGTEVDPPPERWWATLRRQQHAALSAAPTPRSPSGRLRDPPSWGQRPNRRILKRRGGLVSSGAIAGIVAALVKGGLGVAPVAPKPPVDTTPVRK